MKRFTRQLRLLTALILVWMPLVSLVSTAPKVNAVTASDWNPSRIMDDAVFFNHQSMSAQDIQNFLNSKVPVCATNHTKSSNPKDSGPPYTCLKDFAQDVPTMGPDAYCPGTVSAGRKSAATIIKEVSVACNINPQVILVLLQKEQSLITDDWPWQMQYDKATGYGCPDSALSISVDSNQNGCYDAYEGFSRQIYYGARGYQRYVKEPGSYNYAIGRTSYVAYQANNPGCGGTNITMQTQATAALYNYTPYQPNQAALNNMYGSGDTCSAYGNRNFWRMFNDWFGSTMSSIPYTNLQWNFENLDGQNAVNTRPDTTGFQPHTVSFDGKLFVFYHNLTTHRLEMATTSTTPWQVTTLDGAGGTNGRIAASVGMGLSSVVSGNILHLFYQDSTNNDLRHAWITAGTSVWAFETLDGNGTASGRTMSSVGIHSTAITFNDSIQLFYYDSTHGNLRHAWFTGAAGWNFENLEGDWGSISRYNADSGHYPTATAYGNSIQLFYYDHSAGNLRHAWYTPTASWRFENLDGEPGSVARGNATTGIEPTVTVLGGHLQLFYYDASHTNLRHAWTTAAGWHFENFEGDAGSISRTDGSIGRDPVALSHEGLLYIFYRNETNGSIRKAWADQSGWHFAALEGVPSSVNFHLSNTGFHPTATTYGSLQLFYFDNDQRALRHAWGTNRW